MTGEDTLNAEQEQSKACAVLEETETVEDMHTRSSATPK